MISLHDGFFLSAFLLDGLLTDVFIMKSDFDYADRAIKSGVVYQCWDFIVSHQFVRIWLIEVFQVLRILSLSVEP